MNKKKLDFIDSLVKIKDQTNLEESIISIGRDLIKEGFEYEDVVEYVLIKVKQDLDVRKIDIIFS